MLNFEIPRRELNRGDYEVQARLLGLYPLNRKHTREIQDALNRFLDQNPTGNRGAYEKLWEEVTGTPIDSKYKKQAQAFVQGERDRIRHPVSPTSQGDMSEREWLAGEPASNIDWNKTKQRKRYSDTIDRGGFNRVEGPDLEQFVKDRYELHREDPSDPYRWNPQTGKVEKNR